jgi:NAD(P)-dependent dehydrogenase (short-subunit alcohol dehydrogenase family)
MTENLGGASRSPIGDVRGKVAFVAGGSSGVGLGISRVLLDAGMKVVVGYRTPANRDEAQARLGDAGGALHFIGVDVTDRAGMERAAAETVEVFGKVHLLVNNAGVGALVTIGGSTYEDWDWVMRVNVDGVFNGIHAFLPHIRAHGEGGHIVSTASNLGLFVGEGGGGGAYSASKAAVVNLMEGLRFELLGEPISASVYCPGLLISNFMDSSRNRPEDLAHTGAVDARTDEAQRAESERFYAAGMDGMEAGRAVLAGILADDLYIMSHPEFAQGFRERSEAVLASFPDTPVPPLRLEAERAQLDNRIYRDQIARRA